MIKLFTHNDLDGLSCVLLAQLAFGKDAVDFETCRHEDIDEKVSLYFSEKQYKNYSYCYVTDIAMNDELAAQINTLFETPSDYISVIDHHISTSSLSIYDWCHVTIADEQNTKCCGTSLFYKELLSTEAPYKERLLNPLIASFVEKVRRYDVWDWQALEDIVSKQLNDLFSILGKERFMDYWFDRLITDHGDFCFDETQTLLLDLRQNEINQYIEARNAEIVVKEVAGYQAGIVFANRFQSELGNQLALLHPELDFIAMINIGGSVSCRCIKEHVNLAELALSFGGGGHVKAAGFPIQSEIREMVICNIFRLESE